MAGGRPGTGRAARAVVAIGASVLLAVGVVVGTADRGSHRDAPAPAYLEAQLGEALPPAAAAAGGVRTLRPSPGVAARFGDGSVVASGPAGEVSLASADAGDATWRDHRNGVSRPTEFGTETVTVSADRIEESLVVGTRQGVRTWRWRIGATGLTPRVAADGSIGFLDGRRVSDAHIRPVAILDSSGADITPEGLAWELERRGSADVLALTLDDGDLPAPYVIDPAIVVHGTPAAATNGTTATTTLTLPVPVGIALNDLMLAQVTVAGGTGTTITPPVCGCWTLVRRDDAGTSLAQAVYRRAASGSEPASYTWTITSNRASGGIVGYQGVDLASPVDANAGAADATGTSAAVAAPAVTTTRTNDMLVGFFGVRATATFTPPAAMTERFDGTGGSGPGPASAAADVVQAATGSSGVRTATASSAGDWVGQLLALSSDTTNPANSLALSSVSPSGSAYLSGTTLWYRGTGGGAGGGFQLTNTVSDGGSGPASSAFPALGGTTTGWTHTAQTVTSPAGGPYVSTNAFTWGEGTSSAPTEAVVGSDNAGNTATTTLTLTNDSTGPTGAVTAPAASASVRGSSVAVTSSSADAGSGVSGTTFQRSPAGAGTWTTISTDASAPYSVTWNTTLVSDGLYDLRVLATDKVGNTSTSATVSNVRVDNTAPTGSTTAPASSAQVAGGAVTVSSNSADGGSGVASAAFQRSPAGAGTWTTIASDTSAPYSVGWDTVAVSDGLYDLRVVTTDNAGNTFTSSSATNVRVDNTNPTGSLTAPASSAIVRGAAVALSANSADGGSGVANASFQRSPAGAATWTVISSDASSPYAATWDTTAVSDGLYDLRVVTTDNAGNMTASSLATNVRVDNTNPTGSVTAPASSATVSGASVAVTSNSADAGSGVASVTFERSLTGAGSWTTIGSDSTAPYSVTWDTTVIRDLYYDLRAVTTDNAGNTFTSSLATNIKVTDITAPANVISLSSVSPASSSYLSGNTVFYRGTGGGSGGSFQLTNAVVDLGSLPLNSLFPALGGVTTGWTHTSQTVSTPTNGPFTTTNAFTWTEGTTSSPTEAVRSTDNVGLQTTTTLTFTNDSTNPTGSVTAPSASSNIRQTVSVSSSSADGGSGVASATFQRSPAGAGTWTTIGSDTGSPYSVSWNTTLVSDGLYDLRVTTVDNVGNSSTSSLVTNVRVDNTAPTGSVTTPAASANLRLSVPVEANSADVGGSGVANVVLQRSPAGAGTWTDLGTEFFSAYEWTLDTTAVNDGLYDLRVVTTDNAGNVFNSPVTAVRFDNTNPSNSLAIASVAPAASAYLSGTTLWYRGTGGGAGGSLQLRNTVADGGSGPASSAFPALGGITTGWTHTAQTISSPGGGPYVSTNAFTWAEGTSSAPTEVVTGSDNAGNSSPVTLTLTDDSTNPTGSLTTPASSANVRQSISVSSNSADAASGVASVSFQRSPAGAGTWTTIATDSAAPYTTTWDTTGVSDGLYDLRAVTTDNVSNTFTSALVTDVRVDNTAPTAPTVSGGSLSWQSIASVTITGSGSTDIGGSGLAGYEYRSSVDGGVIWGATTAGASLLVAEQGETIVQYRSLDVAGNASDWTPSSPTAGGTARLDRTAPGANAGAELVSNGSFESPSMGAGPTLGTAPSSYGAWSIAAGDVNVWGSALQAGDGVQSVELNGSSAGLITQSIATTAGATYRITFKVAGNPSGGTAVKELRVGWDGATLRTVRFDTTGRSAMAMGWQTVTLEATATSSSTLLEFESLTSGAYGPVVDAVSATPQAGPTVAGGSLSWQSVASVLIGASGATDLNAGLAGYEYRTSTDAGSTWSTATGGASAAVVAEGETLVQFRSLDNAGNASAWAPLSATAGSTVRIDRTAPTDPSVAGGSLSWQDVASVAVTASGSSGGLSGLSGYEYRTSTDAGSTWSASTAGASVTVSAEGETLVQYRSIDGAGNASGWTPSSATAGSTVRIDRTDPSTPAVSGGSLSWQSVASVDVTASGGAGGASGLAGYEYRTSTDAGSTWSGATAGASATVSGEGETLVQFRSLDGAGNASAWEPVSPTAGSTVRIDRTAPTDPTVTGGSLSWQDVASVDVTASGSTGGDSGLSGYEYRTSTDAGSTWSAATAGASVTISSEGETLVQYRSIDGAGNASGWTPSSATAGSTVRIDRTDPTAPTVAGGSLSWQSVASVAVTASGGDGGDSGLAGYEYRTSTDGGSSWSSGTAGASVAVSDEGETLVQYRSIDGAGNVSAWTPSSATAGSTVRIDRTDPGAPTVAGGSLSWQNVPDITISGSAGTGATSYEHRVSIDGGSSWSTPASGASVIVSDEGETLVQFRSVDDAGNVSAWTPSSATAGSTARIDRTDPTAPAVAGGSSSWQAVASVDVSASGASGGDSGLTGYEHRTSSDAGSTWSAAAAGASITISDEGETLVQYRSIDGAGNVSAWTPASATAGSTVRIDRTDPGAPTVSGGSLSWQSVADITITASSGAGASGYEYRTSTDAGSTWSAATAGASVTISSEGETLVQYRSIDDAGNVSAWTPGSATAGSTARIDRTDPTAPTVSGGSLTWQSVASVAVTASGGDGGDSGLAGYEYRTSTDAGSTWSSGTAGASVAVSDEGETLVQYRSIDGAGNVSAWTPSSATAGSTVRIDRTDPGAPTVAGGSLSWQNVADITITASSGAGATSYEHRTSSDSGSTWSTAAAGATVVVSDEGETLVQFRSVDDAGNVSAWTPGSATAGSTSRIDRTDPTAPTVSGGSLGWQSVASVAVTASGGDGGDAGLAGYEYRTSTDAGSTWSGATAGSSATISAEGETLVQYRSLDGAGNVSAWTPASATAGSTVRIDRTDPGAPTVSGGSLSWQNVADITITASSGVGAVSYEHRTSTDSGSTWSTATAGAMVVVSDEGETLVQFRSADDAGNVSAWTPGSATAASTARIDRTDPTVPTVSGGSLAWQGAASVTVTASGASGGDSGLAGYEHRTSTDGGATWDAPASGASVVVSALGETLVQYRAVDGASNVSAWAPAHLGGPDAEGTVRLGALALATARRVSTTGPDGDAGYDALWPDAAHNAAANEYLIVWTGDTGSSREDEVWGRLTSGGGEAVGDAFRLSSMGPEGDASYTAWEPRAVYNPAADEYLVVWFGDDDAGALADNEFEVYAQRVSAAGAEVGTDDVRISSMGPDGDASFDAWNPRVAYNGDDDEYLVVWEGDDDAGGSVDNASEIFGQRLSATLAEIGVDDLRISSMGPEGSAAFDALRPDVAYNTVSGEYLVAWQGDDDTAPLVDNEQEIFVQRLSASGAAVGTDDMRVSDMGADGAASADAATPAIAVDRIAGDVLVAWSGDDASGGLADDEYEIFVQRLTGAGAEAGVNDRRISSMGPDGAAEFGAHAPAAAWNAETGQYLVAWTGSDDAAGLADSELEVYAQPLLADGSEAGSTDIRVSEMGPDGDASFGAGRASVASGTGSLTFLAAWDGSDDGGALVAGESEIHSRVIAIDPTAPTAPSLTGGSASWRDQASDTITASGSDDPESGLAGYEHRASTDGGSTWSAAAAGASVTVTAEGETIVQFRAVNGHGDQTAWVEALVRLDRTDPADPAASGGSASWTGAGPVTVTGGGSSGGPSGTTWEHRTSTDAGATWSAAAPGVAAVVGDPGETLVQFRVVDGAGNTSGWAPAAGSAGATVRLDLAAPTAPVVSGGSASWQVTPSITIAAGGSADPGGSGVAGYEWRSTTDGGVTWSAATAGASAVISDEGETLVQFRALDVVGNASSWTPSAGDPAGQARIDNGPPPTPTGLAGPVVTSGGPVLTWDPVAGAASYIVTRDGAPVGSPTGASFTDSTAPGEGSYAYRVIAVDGPGNQSAPSAPVTVEIDTTPPPAPSEGGISGGSAGWTNAASVVITGTPPVGATLEHRTSTDAGGTWSSASAGAVATVTAAGETIVQFRAVDPAGNASAWVPASASPATTARIDRTAPAVPAGLTGAGVTSAQPVIGWTAVAGAAGYRILRDGVEVGTTAGTGFTDSALTAGGTYLYRVIAVDEAGNASAASAGVTVEFAPADVIPPNTTIASAPASPTNDPTPTLTLSATETATFECSVDAGPWTACATPATIAALADGSHTIAARARDAAGNVDASPAQITLVVDTVAPPAPALTATADTTLALGSSAGRVLLTMTGAGDAVRVVVTQGPRTVYDGASAVSVPDLVADGATHVYDAVGVDAAGNVSASVSASATTPDRTPPAPPTGPSGAGYPLALTWTAVPGADQYVVARDGTTALTTGTASVTDTGALDLAAPPAPSGLSANVLGSGRVSLSWATVTDAGTGYTLAVQTVDAVGNASVFSPGTSLVARSGIAAYHVLLDGTPLVDTVATSLDVDGLAAGSQHTLSLVAEDGAGNVSPASAPVVVTIPADPSTAPRLSVSVDRAYARPGDAVTFTAALEGSGTGPVTWTLDSGVQMAGLQVQHTYATAGRRMVRAVVSGSGGQSASSTVEVIVDATPPAMDLVLSGNRLAVTGSDADSGVQRIEWTPEAGGAPRQLVNGGIPLKEGRNRITIRVIDRAGNVSEVVRELVGDTVAPVLEIRAPAMVQRARATVRLTVTDAGSGLAAVEYGRKRFTRVPARLTVTAGKPVTVTAIDVAGNRRVATFTVRRIPTAPKSVRLTWVAGEPRLTGASRTLLKSITIQLQALRRLPATMRPPDRYTRKLSLAVAKYQRAARLRPTGIVDPATRARLARDLAKTFVVVRGR